MGWHDRQHAGQGFVHPRAFPPIFRHNNHGADCCRRISPPVFCAASSASSILSGKPLPAFLKSLRHGFRHLTSLHHVRLHRITIAFEMIGIMDTVLSRMHRYISFASMTATCLTSRPSSSFNRLSNACCAVRPLRSRFDPLMPTDLLVNDRAATTPTPALAQLTGRAPSQQRREVFVLRAAPADAGICLCSNEKIPVKLTKQSYIFNPRFGA